MNGSNIFTPQLGDIYGMMMMCGAAFSQLLGLFSDGTPVPMAVIMSVAGALCLAAGVTSFVGRNSFKT